MGPYPPTFFLKISPGCQPRSPDIRQKPRRRSGSAEARSGKSKASSEALPKKDGRKLAFSLSAFHVALLRYHQRKSRQPTAIRPRGGIRPVCWLSSLSKPDWGACSGALTGVGGGAAAGWRGEVQPSLLTSGTAKASRAVSETARQAGKRRPPLIVLDMAVCAGRGHQQLPCRTQRPCVYLLQGFKRSRNPAVLLSCAAERRTVLLLMIAPEQEGDSTA